MRVDPRRAFYWHAFFLALTTSLTEVNTVMPALVLEAGGTVVAVGALTAIMIGLPLVSQLLFAGFLHTRPRKKPYLLLGINMRVLALAFGAAAILTVGISPLIIPAVFLAMTVFSLSGAFAGVSYTDLVGRLVRQDQRRVFFVRRQVISSLGLLVSAVVTRFLLGATAFPDGYAWLFAAASGFLLVASAGFWALAEPRPAPAPDASAPETSAPDASAPGTLGRETSAGDTSGPEAPGPDAQGRSGRSGRGGMAAALRQAPVLLRQDANLRSLILVVNLFALGITSIPLVTALALRTYEPSPATVGTFVVIQISGMLLLAPVWTRVIRRGGFRLLLTVEVALLVALFPLALVLSATAPLAAFAALYLLTGAILSAQRISVDGALVQISPDGSRALYAGVFGAANLASAVLPLLTGVLVSSVGYPVVFVAASIAAAGALGPVRRLECGTWYQSG